MKKIVIYAFIATLFLAGSQSFALYTRDIDQIRNKSVLNQQDLEAVDSFVESALQEYAASKDFGNIARLRSEILERANAVSESSQPQYQAQFKDSVVKYMPGIIESVSNSSDPESYKNMINMLILVDELENPKLAHAALEYIDHEVNTVSYWALKCVTGKAVSEEINSGNLDNIKIIKNVIDTIAEHLPEFNEQRHGLVVQFLKNTDSAMTKDLLDKLIEVRLERYKNWDVEDELIESGLLKVICDKISNNQDPDSDYARSFGQLFSYVMQRYIKGYETLSDGSLDNLESVMAETESNCIVRITDIQQSVLKSAIENDNLQAIIAEHDRLLGKEDKAGQIPEKLGYSYGLTDQGNDLLAPADLPAPKQQSAEQAA